MIIYIPYNIKIFQDLLHVVVPPSCPASREGITTTPSCFIITGHGDVPMAIEALKAGAVDFIEKPFRDQVLLDAIQNAVKLDADQRSKRTGQAEIEAKLALLTKRERQIMDLLAAGKSNKEVAYELGISQKTVDFHRAHVIEKMDVESVVQLLRLLQKLDFS